MTKKRHVIVHVRDLVREQSMAAEASRSSLLLLQALINFRDPQMRNGIPYRLS